MVKIADDLARATELVRTFTRGGWDYALDNADRDALVWLLEVAGGQHAYIRSLAFRDVVTAAYQMGRQAGLNEGDGETSEVERGTHKAREENYP